MGCRGLSARFVAGEQALRACPLVRGVVTCRYAPAWAARGLETSEPCATKGRRLRHLRSGDLAAGRPRSCRPLPRASARHKRPAQQSLQRNSTERAGNRAFRPAQFPSRVPESAALRYPWPSAVRPSFHEQRHSGPRARPVAQRAALQGGRHGARALPGHRGHTPPRAGLRGDRAQAAGSRRARDLHRAQAVVRHRGRADVPAPLAEDREDRGHGHRRRQPREALLPPRARRQEGARARAAVRSRVGAAGGGGGDARGGRGPSPRTRRGRSPRRSPSRRSRWRRRRPRPRSPPPRKRTADEPAEEAPADESPEPEAAAGRARAGGRVEPTPAQ